MSGQIRAALKEILPAGAVLPEGASVRWPADVPSPEAVVAPTSEAQVAEVMDRATREGWKVLPGGLCTWLDGGGTPEVDLVVSTRNLSRMQSYEPADLTFTAGAGVPWKALGETTRVSGQWLPLDPPGMGTGSLGGLVATGTSGPLRHAYGAPRDHILGVTLVSGDGRILRWGGRVVKNVAGFDITRLSIGSWGALGVITSVSARLFPLPEVDRTILLRAPSAEDLLPVAREMALSPLPFSAVELLDPLSAVWPFQGNEPGERVRRPHPRRGGEPAENAGAGLVLRILGSEAQVREMEARVRVKLSGPGKAAGESLLVLRDEESLAFHETLAEWETGAVIVLRLSLLPSIMRTSLEEVREVGARFGPLDVAAHMGWGVVRVAFAAAPAEEGDRKALADALTALRTRLEAGGGGLVVSQAPRSLLEAVGAWGQGGGEGRLMRGLKEEFDPAGILSPGRFGD